jgi:hypothetical protein
MIFNFSDEDSRCLFVALMRAQGDILVQLETQDCDRIKLKEEYTKLERIALNIQRTFK